MSTKYKRKELEDYGWDNSWNKLDKHTVLNFIILNKLGTEKLIKHLFPELYSSIQNCLELGSIKLFPQKLYHYLHDDLKLEKGKCKYCGKQCSFKNLNSGYAMYCGPKCQMHDPEMLDRIKNTNIHKYGTPYALSNVGVQNKRKETNILKYGVENPAVLLTTKSKAAATCLKKFGVKAYSQTEEYKNTLKNYTVFPAQTPEVQAQRRRTCEKKYSACCYLLSREYFDYQKGKKKEKLSKLEKEFELYLQENNISYKTQYISKVYPYRCDFYLPDSDLYVELNGTWTHGNEPFNKWSNKHNDILNIWKEKAVTSKYYLKAIRTWTVLDLDKMHKADTQLLNLMVLYDLKALECFLKIIPALSKVDTSKLKESYILMAQPKNPLVIKILDKLKLVEQLGTPIPT